MERKAKKKFDALAFKEEAQAEISKTVEGMSPAQQRAYFERRAETGPLGEWWKRVKKATLERKRKSGSS